MTPSPQTLECCWCFPHRLKLRMRVREDGEQAVSIERIPDGERETPRSCTVCERDAGDE